MWHGRTPVVSYFKQFGCKVFCLNKTPTKGKFDSRAKKGIFIGYSEESKAFQIWLPECKKVEITREVKFQEGSFPTPSSFEDFYIESKQPAQPENSTELIDVDLSPDVLHNDARVVEIACVGEIPVGSAISGEYASEWITSMVSEVKSLIKKNTWTLIRREEGYRVIESKFVLRIKCNSSGKVETRKARVVERGFS